MRHLTVILFLLCTSIAFAQTQRTVPVRHNNETETFVIKEMRIATSCWDTTTAVTNQLWYNGNQLNLSTGLHVYPEMAITVQTLQFVIIDGALELEVTCIDRLGTHIFHFLKQNGSYVRIGS